MHQTIHENILPNVSKPARYIGNELNSVHKDSKDKVKVVLCYPDSYEIGMSNLGIAILYRLINKRDDSLCERVFSPWNDMEKKMEEYKVHLFSLESWTPVKDFDIVGFSVQNELTYTNLLNILKLSGIPLKRKDRKASHPLIIAGGACTNNPEPLSDFIDAFVIGDGEEVMLEIIDAYKSNDLRPDLLASLSKIGGIYVPGYNESANTTRRVVKDINTIDYPTKPIVPFIEIIHDRATIEIMRGCPRRCAFCQAGNTTKPVRLMKPERIKALARETIKNTGFEEISFVSLSSSDYPGLAPIAVDLGKEFAAKRISLALPSMRSDSFSKELSDEIQNVRKGGVTLAPEAGTQRLRDLICKDLNEEAIISSAKAAFVGGAKSLKLYFMIGLPTETDEDLQGIVDLANKIMDEVRAGGRLPQRFKLTINISTFIPKKNTPFGDRDMIALDEIRKKQNYLKQNLSRRSIELRWHTPEMSVIEGLFSQGGKEAGAVLQKAFDLGCRFDNWEELFDYSKWEAAIAQDKD